MSYVATRVRSRPWSALCLLTFAALAGFALFRGLSVAAPQVDTPTPPTAMDPNKVMGAQSCIECHKPMIPAWQATKHATEFDKLRQNPNAQTYATALGIAQADITGNSVCVTCHGMRANATAIKATTGVGCESCHGASGGDPGWLNPHGSYGANKGMTREQETPEHRAMRFEICDKAGMIRPERTYLIAKNCVDCHMMYKHENVVNKAGHHAGSSDFELVSWIHGEIDHNLFIDPKKNPGAPSLWMARYKKTPQERNRVLYVVGKLAGMEVALRNVAESTSENNFSQAMAGHARDLRDDLSDIRDATMLPEIGKIVEEFGKFRRKIKPDNKGPVTEFADMVAKTAIEFVKNNHGSKLAGVDSLIPTNVRGKRYIPE